MGRPSNSLSPAALLEGFSNIESKTFLFQPEGKRTLSRIKIHSQKPGTALSLQAAPLPRKGGGEGRQERSNRSNLDGENGVLYSEAANSMETRHQRASMPRLQLEKRPLKLWKFGVVFQMPLPQHTHKHTKTASLNATTVDCGSRQEPMENFSNSRSP